jgi:hypothetical protein
MRAMAIMKVKRNSELYVLEHLHLRIGKEELYASGIIVFSACLRILLVCLGWPPTNSDEGTMGIMALHIASHGEHPIYFYGQDYMGALEAYLAAVSFHLFGVSLLTLRLGVILLSSLFLASMYLLTSLLYTKKMALAVLVLLSMGSSGIVLREIYATGGSSQTLLFGSLSFCLATWLSMTYNQDLTPAIHSWRIAAYSLWGLVIGLGLWSDMVVLPFFMMSGLLLLLFCWRDWRTWVPLSLLSLIIGAFPSIVYDFHRGSGNNALFVLLGLFHGSVVQAPHTLAGYLHGIEAAFIFSLPTATGDPSCPVAALKYAGDLSVPAIQCVILHSFWFLGYVILWAISIFLTVRGLWKLRVRKLLWSSDERNTIVCLCSRLFLLSSASIVLAVYSVSEAPQFLPVSHARYLVGLLIVTPAIIWPLWDGANIMKSYVEKETTERTRPHSYMRALISRGLLLCTGVLFLLGTMSIFAELPATQASNRQQDALIANLQRIGATHIFSDYWSCDRIAFVSQEKITCAVIDNNLQPTHNRSNQYYTIVNADPHSAYVYPLDLLNKDRTSIIIKKSNILSENYRRFEFDGYVVYQPV